MKRAGRALGRGGISAACSQCAAAGAQQEPTTFCLLLQPSLPPIPRPPPPLRPAHSGGPRKCVGDQFALMEAVTALAVVLKRYTFRLKADQEIGMTTGATIHTTNGLYMHVVRRGGAAEAAAPAPAAAVSA